MRFRDKASCELRGMRFAPQARFLCAAGKNLFAAGKTSVTEFYATLLKVRIVFD